MMSVKTGVKFFADKVYVAGVGKIGASGFKEPERRVNGVVFGRFAGVGKSVGQHALVHVLRERAQDAPRDFMLASWQA